MIFTQNYIPIVSLIFNSGNELRCKQSNLTHYHSKVIPFLSLLDFCSSQENVRLNNRLSDTGSV